MITAIIRDNAEVAEDVLGVRPWALACPHSLELTLDDVAFQVEEVQTPGLEPIREHVGEQRVQRPLRDRPATEADPTHLLRGNLTRLANRSREAGVAGPVRPGKEDH